MDQSNEIGARVGRLIIAKRWPILIISIVHFFMAAYGLQFLRPNGDYRIFFTDDNPQVVEFDKVQATYTRIDNVYFTVTPEDGSVFSAGTLAALEALTEGAWRLPYAQRVDSLTNFQYTRGEGDDLYVQDLVSHGGEAQALTPEEVGRIAVSEPELLGRLVPRDGRTTGVNVTFRLPGQSLTEVPEAAAAARELATRIAADYPVDIELTGMVVLNDAFNAASIGDMVTLVPAMYLMIIVIALVLLRSVTATIGTLLVVIFSMFMGLGVGGFLGVLITPPSSVAPTLISTLAVADSIHFLITMQTAMRKGMDRRSAIVESMRVNFWPILLTSVTTAIGFLTMNFADTPPFRDLGNIAAAGIMIAWFYSITFLPAFVAVLPVRAPKATTRWQGWMESFANGVIAARTPILVAFGIGSLVILAFIPRNVLQDDFVRYFDKSTEFRQAVDYTNDNLTGIYQLQLSLPSGQAEGVSDPAFLSEVDGFVSWLRTQPEVRHVAAITDTLKRLNRNLHGDDPSYYRLPEDRALSAQYLLLYELSLPYGLDLNNQLNVDKSATQVVVTVSDLSANGLKDIADRAETWLAENTSIRSIAVGPAVMFAHITERNIRAMITGTLVAIVLISGLLVIAFRDLKIGLLSLVPNLLPAGLAFGLWGLLVGEVNVAVSVVSGMSLGIVVDDTIHFLSKYLRARREKGFDAADAVRYAFSTVGVAIVVTSFILIAGFLVLGQSSFGMNSIMAKLTALTILIALVADFLLLPALLMWLDRRAPSAAKVEASAKPA